MTTRLLRSMLFVPGARPDRFDKALASGADAVVFDLEDSVEASRKADARQAVRAFLDSPSHGSVARLVRVNDAGSPWFAHDLEMIATLGAIDGAVLPKAEHPLHVEELGRASANRAVIPLLETARGVLDATAIAGANAFVPALLFGAEDLTAQLGIPRTVDGDELLFARSKVVLAAAAAGADAVDAVFIDLDDLDGLRRDARRARALGFRGKMAIHPGQVAAINEVFTPTAEEAGRARALMDAYEAALARGEGVIRLDDKMVDTPVVERAKRLLARAKLGA